MNQYLHRRCGGIIKDCPTHDEAYRDRCGRWINSANDAKYAIMEEGSSNLGHGGSKPMTLDQYIDLMLIDEYADKDLHNGYSLDIDTLSEHELSNFLDKIMASDTSLRETILIQMQEMVDARCVEVTAEERGRAGFRTVYRSNGDSYTEVPRGYYYDE
jgi:hypothetical protein